MADLRSLCALDDRPASGQRSGFRRNGQRLRVLIIVGHPRASSFSEALAAAYREGALRARAEVHELQLAELAFDLNQHSFDPERQTVEDDVRLARALIAWADHLVLVYPVWWGTMPALLKGFLDRVLAPGFAFEDREDGPGWRKLLRGKTADLITTMDTPGWVYRWIYRAPGHNAMRRAILGFCGIEVVSVRSFGPVKESAPEDRQVWLDAARRRGLALSDGPFPAFQRLSRKVSAWLQAFRLQFYPMTWLAYSLGALLAAAPSAGLDATPFWLGLACIAFLEIATVLANDYFDLDSDCQNLHFGPFNGGSRMLVDGRLTVGEVRVGIALALALALLAFAALLAFVASPEAAGLVLGAMAILALGYTVPPLKLSYRGLGELDVGLTHATGAVLCGFVLQGGTPADPAPWLLSLPLLLAILPGITLAGVPDHDADRAAGKGTLAVRFGVRAAWWIAGGATLVSAGAALVLQRSAEIGALLAGIEYVVLPHATLLLWMIAREASRDRGSARIDGLMIAALAYVPWFVAVPLWHLLG